MARAQAPNPDKAAAGEGAGEGTPGPIHIDRRVYRLGDPALSALAHRLEAGTATMLELRMWYWLEPRLYPYDKPIPTDWREKAILAIRRLRASNDRLFRSTNAPRDTFSWERLGPLGFRNKNGDWVSGRATALWVDPDDSYTVLLGTADGGLWKTTDQGRHWAFLFDGPSSLSIGAIAVDPNNKNIIFVATGEGNWGSLSLQGDGIFKSTDGGSTWSHCAPPAGVDAYSGTFNRIVIDPRDSNRVYAAGSTGLWYTLDGGVTWDRPTYVRSNTYDLVVDSVTPPPGTPSTLYIAYLGSVMRIEGGPTSDPEFLTSTQSGFPQSDVGRTVLVPVPDHPNKLYALVAKDQDHRKFIGVYYCDDASLSDSSQVSWSEKTSEPFCENQCFYNLAGAVSPDDPQHLAFGGIDLWLSDDSGDGIHKVSAWNGTGTHFSHADHHAVAFVNDTTIYDANDGGFFIGTIDWEGTFFSSPSVTWESRNQGLDTLQFYGIAHDPGDPDRVIGGLQDNGEVLSEPGAEPLEWTQIHGGDGGISQWDGASPTFAYHEYVYASVFRHDKMATKPTSARCLQNFGGCDECSKDCKPDGNCQFIAPYTLDANNANTMYVGCNNLYKNSDPRNDNEWTRILQGSTEHPEVITAVHSAANGGVGGVLYVGRHDGSVSISRDGGTTWTNDVPPGPYRVISEIATDPANGSRVFLTFSGYNSGHVYRSADGGSTWTNISGGLPDVPFNTVVIDPDNPNHAWVGSDFGVYENKDVWNSDQWLDARGNLPAVAVVDLSFAGGHLYAATHGRGVWRLGENCETPDVPSLNGPASGHSGVAYQLTWAGTSIDGTYELEEASTPDFSNPQTILVSGTAKNFLHGVGVDTTYYYRVRAKRTCTSVLYSGYSNVVSVRLEADPGNLLASVEPVSPDIGQPATISVAVHDGIGNPVGAGRSVTFSTTYPGYFSGNGASSTSSPSTVMTDSSGQTWIWYTSDVAGHAAVTIESPGEGEVESTVVGIDFVDPSGGMKVTVTVGYYDGSDTESRYHVTARVTDSDGDPVSGQWVVFGFSPSSYGYWDSSDHCSTGPQGSCSQDLVVTHEGSITVTATAGQSQGATTFTAYIGSSGGSEIFPIKTLSGLGSHVCGVDFSADGTLLLAGSRSAGKIYAWRTANWTNEWGPKNVRQPTQITVSPSSTYLLVASDDPDDGGDNGMNIFRMTDGGFVCTSSLDDGRDGILGTWGSTDSSFCGTHYTNIDRFSSRCSTGSLVNFSLEADDNGFEEAGHMDYSSSKHWFAACSEQGNLYVWDTSGNRIQVLGVSSPNNAYDTDFSVDGSKLAAVGYNAIKIFNTSSWVATSYTASSLASQKYGVKFIDGDTKFAVGASGKLEILNVSDGSSFATATVTGRAQELAWNETNQELAVGTDQGYVYVFKPLVRDMVPPIISVSTPVDQAVTNEDSVETTGRVTDDVSVAQFTINGTAVAMDSDGFFCYTVSLVEGDNTISYRATDPSGHVAEETRTVTRVVDHTAPSIENVGVSPANGIVGTVFNLQATVLDSDTGVASVQGTVRDSNGSSAGSFEMNETSLNRYSGSWNSSGQSVGVYTFDVTATDSSPQANQRILSGAAAVEIIPMTGTVQVTLDPAAAVQAGGEWRIDSSGWKSSGESVEVVEGMHTISYKAIPGWEELPEESVDVPYQGVIRLSRYYRQTISGCGHYPVDALTLAQIIFVSDDLTIGCQQLDFNSDETVGRPDIPAALTRIYLTGR